MIKLFVFLKRKPGLTHEEFLTYWEKTHAPLVMSVPEFTRHVRCYAQNHAILEADIPELVLSDFDGATELWFDGLDDLTSALDEPRYHELVEPSAERFIDPRNVVRVVAEEAVQFDRGFGTVKFMGLSRRHPRFTHDEWIRYWIDVHAPMAHGIPEFTRYYGRYVHNYILPIGLDPSGEAPEYDGVVEESVESVEDMAKCLSEPGYLEVVRPDELEFVDFGHSHMLLVEEKVIHDARGV